MLLDLSLVVYVCLCCNFVLRRSCAFIRRHIRNFEESQGLHATSYFRYRVVVRYGNRKNREMKEKSWQSVFGRSD